MLNDDEIVTFVQEESDLINDETNEDKDNNKSSKGPSNADASPALEKAMELYEQQSECYPTQLQPLKRIRDVAAKKRRCTMVQRKVIIFHSKKCIVKGVQLCFRRFAIDGCSVEDQHGGGREKVFEDAELEALLDQDSCQTQQELSGSLGVTQQAISKRLKVMGMIQKQGNWVPYELKLRC
ncbi:mariner Mos1 transposase [Trichonephila clavipes]|nr:mariner Mos1 transposase [Trichonephila clavipes]